MGPPVRSLRRHHRPADRQESDPSEGPAHEAASHPYLWKRPVEKEETSALLTPHIADRFVSSPDRDRSRTSSEHSAVETNCSIRTLRK